MLVKVLVNIPVIPSNNSYHKFHEMSKTTLFARRRILWRFFFFFFYGINKPWNVSNFLMGMGLGYCYFENFLQVTLNWPRWVRFEFDPASSYSLFFCFLPYYCILKKSLKDSFYFEGVYNLITMLHKLPESPTWLLSFLEPLVGTQDISCLTLSKPLFQFLSSYLSKETDWTGWLFRFLPALKFNILFF